MRQSVKGYAVGISSILTENSTSIKVCGISVRNVNYYFCYDYLHICSEERVGLGCYRVGREQRRSYMNKYKWCLPYS